MINANNFASADLTLFINRNSPARLVVFGGQKHEYSFTLKGREREDIIRLDVSRVTGRFTSMFPVFLKITDKKNISKSEVREQAAES